MLDDDEENIENVPVVQTYQVPAEKNRSKFFINSRVKNNDFPSTGIDSVFDT